MFPIRFISILLACSCGALATPGVHAQGTSTARVKTVTQLLAFCSHHRSARFGATVKGFYVHVFTGSAGPTADGAVFASRQRHTELRSVPPRALALFTTELVPQHTAPRAGSWVILQGSMYCTSGYFNVTSFQYEHRP